MDGVNQHMRLTIGFRAANFQHVNLPKRQRLKGIGFCLIVSPNYSTGCCCALKGRQSPGICVTHTSREILVIVLVPIIVFIQLGNETLDVAGAER